MSTTSSLHQVKTSVIQAAGSILAQDALKTFPMILPSFDSITKSSQQCTDFKEKFPVKQLQKGEKLGIISGAWAAFSGLFSDLYNVFELPQQIPPNEEDSFAVFLEKGRQGLNHLDQQLAFIEDLLLTKKGTEEDKTILQALRETRNGLKICPPLMLQGSEAAGEWAARIEKELEKTNLILKTHRDQERETHLKNTNDPSSLRLTHIIEASEPLPNALFCHLFKSIGSKTGISEPSITEAAKGFASLAKASKNAYFQTALQDIPEFTSWMDPFEKSLASYPLQRFLSEGTEFEDLIQPAAKQFHSVLQKKLDELDGNIRSEIFIPFSSYQISIQPLLDWSAKMSVEELPSALSLAKRGQLLFRIQKGNTGYDIRLYPSHDGSKKAYTIYENVSKQTLLDPSFLERWLGQASLSAKTGNLKNFWEAFSEHSQPKSCSWNDFLCHLMRPVEMGKNYIGTRFNELLHSLGAKLGLNIEKSLDELKAQWNHPEFWKILSKIEFSVSMEAFLRQEWKNANLSESTQSFESPKDESFAIWEALFTGDHEKDLFFDLQLAALMKAIKTPPKSIQEAHELLLWEKRAFQELHQEKDKLSLSETKKNLIDFYLSEAALLLKTRQEEIDRWIKETIPPVQSSPSFDRFHLEIMLPKTHPARAQTTPLPSNQFKPLGVSDSLNLKTWTPSLNNLDIVDAFAKHLGTAYEAGNYNGIVGAVPIFFERFNLVFLDEQFWNNLTEIQAEKLLSSLETTSTAYFKSYFDADVSKIPGPESGLIMMESVAIASRILAKLPEYPEWMCKGLSLQEFYPYLFNRAPFFQLVDPQLDARFQAVQDISKNQSQYSPEELLFGGTNLAPIQQKYWGEIFGNLDSVPKIGFGLISIPLITQRPPAERFIAQPLHSSDSLIFQLVQKFADRIPDHMVTNQTILNILTGKTRGILPDSFYSLRKVLFHAQYFFRGSFLKPSKFTRSKESYELNFKITDVEWEINPTASILEIPSSFLTTQLKCYYLQAEVTGIDESIFKEQPDAFDGLTKAHQFSQNRRPALHPAIQHLHNRHLVAQGNPKWDAFHGFFGFTSFAPGVTESGRNLYDLNVVMSQPSKALRGSLTDRQYKILASLRGEPEVQIANTLSFFREHSGLLKDPDMQSYFLSLLFDPGLLLNELRQPERGPELEKQLSEFASSRYNLQKHMGSQEGIDFYLGLMARLRLYSLWARKEAPSSYNQSPLPEIYERFSDLLEEGLSISAKSSQGWIHGLFALQWSLEPSLKEDQILPFLRHCLLYHKTPPSGKTIDPFLEEGLKRLLSRFAPEIVQKTTKDMEWVKNLLLEIVPELSTSISLKVSAENPLVFHVEEHPVSIHLQHGLVTAPGLEGVPLPADALAHPIYTSLYENKEFLCKIINSNTFEFTDHKNKINRILRTPQEGFVLQRKFPTKKEAWYQYIPSDHFLKEAAAFSPKQTLFDTLNPADTLKKQLKISLEQSESTWKGESRKHFDAIYSWLFPTSSKNSFLPVPLLKGFSHWMSTQGSNKDILIVDPQGKITYRVELSGSQILENMGSTHHTATKIHRLTAEGTDELELVNLDSAPFLGWTVQFEEKDQTLVWKNPANSEPVRIEFPRYGFSFVRQKGRFYSEQFPGYFLKKTQQNPMGANCPNFLLMENELGDEKLILANVSIASAGENRLMPRLQFERAPRIPGEKISFFSYEKPQRAKEFTQTDPSANLYLALMHGAQQQYAQAFRLLRRFQESSSPLSEEQVRLLNEISSLNQRVGDSSSAMTALRAFAYVIVASKQQESQSPQNPIAASNVSSLYSSLAVSYFLALPELGSLRLGIKEEWFLAKDSLSGIIPENIQQILENLVHSKPEKAKEAMLTVRRLISGQFPTLSEITNLLTSSSRPSNSLPDPQQEIALAPVIEDPFKYVSFTAQNLENRSTSLDGVFFTNNQIGRFEKKALEFYQQDVESARSMQTVGTYAFLDEKGLYQQRLELEKEALYLKESLLQAELSILRSASKNPIASTPTDLVKKSANELPLDLNDLIQFYMNRNYETLRLTNGNLSKSDIDQIDALIGIYLDLAIQNEQRERIIGRIKEIEEARKNQKETGAPELQTAIQSFVDECRAVRNFDSKEHRVLKVFEYHNGYYYRKNQIDNLQLLGVDLKKAGEGQLFESLIREMMVGQGKTTYLLPTVGYWNADGKRLSMAVMLRSMIGNMAKEVEKICGKTFSQKIKRFTFNRNTDLSPKHLKSIQNTLEEAIRDKDYVITTDQDLKAFINQFLIVLTRAIDSNDLESLERVEPMRSIFHLFHKANVLGDEIDQILNPRIELNFPAGEAIPISPDYIDLTLYIYRLLLTPEIQKICTFEFSSQEGSCTPRLFEEKIKPKLAELLIESLTKDGSQLQELRKMVRQNIQSKREWFKNYFQSREISFEIENWILKQPKEIQDQLAFIRGQLNEILPLTLQKNYGEGYGFADEKSVGIVPFKGSNDPNIGSKFSNPFEEMNYLTQSYLKYPGIRRPIVEQLIQDLQTRAIKEMLEKKDEIARLAPGTSFKTQAHLEFERYFGKDKDLSLMHPEIVDRLIKKITQNPEAKFALLETYILPTVTVYSKNLKATSQLFGFLFKKLKGMTGTLWNSSTYPDSFEAKFDQGARGKVIDLVLKQAKGNTSEIFLSKGTDVPKTLIVGQKRYEHIKALIDSGGALRESNLKDVAKGWLENLPKNSPIGGIAYFEEHGQQMIWERGKERPIPLSESTLLPNERITIYDQKHTTGTDIRQAIDATALVTVSKKMILRDFIQAVGRMRQLASGQKVELAILHPDALAIREFLGLGPEHPLDVEEVIRYLILNEARQQAEDNQVATRHKLTSALQGWFFERILKAPDITTVIQDLKKDRQLLDNLFFDTNVLSAFASYGQGATAQNPKGENGVFTKMGNNLLDRTGLKNVLTSKNSFLGNQKDFKNLEQTLATIVKKADLPDEVYQKASESNMEQQQEIEQEQEQEIEQQQEQQQQVEQTEESSGPRNPESHLAWDFPSLEVLSKDFFTPSSSTEDYCEAYFSLANNILKNNTKLKVPELFDEQFLLSANFNRSEQSPFGEFQKPLQNLLIIQEQNSLPKLIAIEPYDAAVWKQKLGKRIFQRKDPDLWSKYPNRWWKYPDQDYFSRTNDWNPFRCERSVENRPGNSVNSQLKVKIWIGDLNGYSLYETTPSISKTSLASAEFQRLLVQAKYFNGEVQYTKEEQRILANWLREKAADPTGTKIAPDRLNDLEDDFKKVIIAFHEEAKKSYSSSSLKTVFDELKEGKCI